MSQIDWFSLGPVEGGLLWIDWFSLGPVEGGLSQIDWFSLGPVGGDCHGLTGSPSAL